MDTRVGDSLLCESRAQFQTSLCLPEAQQADRTVHKSHLPSFVALHHKLCKSDTVDLIAKIVPSKQWQKTIHILWDSTDVISQ